MIAGASHVAMPSGVEHVGANPHDWALQSSSREQASCADPERATWREVDLRMTVRDNGERDELEVRLLRSASWFREHHVTEGSVVDISFDEDLNVAGPALVTKVGTTNQIAPGARCPVTGWIRHTSRDVIAVALEGGETLGVTRHHRLFSADRRNRSEGVADATGAPPDR